MVNRKEMTAAYYKALNLPPEPPASRTGAPKKAALDRAHDLRKFEIENYWKRATYFWSFQAIAFAVLGFILRDGKLPDPLQIMQLPAAIGAVSGFVGWLSASGSKYWQENWESHVDMLEQDVEGRLTQTIWSDGKVSHSVSRLNQTFMAILTASWIVVMAIPIFGTIPDWIVRASPCWLFALLIAILVGIWWSTRQNFAGYVLDQDSWISTESNQIWSWRKRGESKEKRQLMLRHTKAEDAVKPQD